MKDITILKSAVGSPSAPGSIACFKNNGERNIRVVGIDMSDDPSVKYMVDSFYKVPAATSSDYVDIVLDICKKERVDIYFPSISSEVSAIVARKDEFDKLGVILSISNRKSIDISNNKLLTYKALRKANIDIPKFYEVNSIDDFEKGCLELGFPKHPVCLKIVDGSGSRGVRIINPKKSRYDAFAKEKPNSFLTSYDDMISILSEKTKLDKMMLVEYMSGNEYTVDLLAKNGEVIYIMGRENVVSLMSIAQDSIIVKDEYAYEICRKIVKLLNMDGNIGFDFMRDENGKPYLMDINPRLTATISLAAAGGLNLPYLRVKQLLGEELPKIDVKYGVRIRRRYKEYFTDEKGELIAVDFENVKV